MPIGCDQNTIRHREERKPSDRGSRATTGSCDHGYGGGPCPYCIDKAEGGVSPPDLMRDTCALLYQPPLRTARPA